MPKPYNPSVVEAKWQERWEKAKLYHVDLQKAKKPYYSMVMWPYPSGDKLHVGHWYNFGPADSFSRFMRMQGRDVLTPMGFDAFGLPAENYAVKTGVHPRTSIAQNVKTMIGQLKRMGCMYDWSKMQNSSLPEYYRWTQWLFLQMFKNGLAYRKKANVNFCPKCQTVLANEQVWDGKCERCETEVIQKPMTQWFWKITDYADRLINNLDTLDWPEKTKAMQRNWIGRKEGIVFRERVKDLDIAIEVFDTVPQTFLAQTFAIIAPEHPLVSQLVAGTKEEKDVLEFSNRVAAKKASGNFDIENEMEGIFTGRYVDNPFGTGDLPIWVASFVVADYGTGIVNCSAHDERDFAFAKKYGIPLKTVMVPQDEGEAKKVRNLEYAYCKADDGILDTPDEVKGIRWKDAYEPIVAYITKKKLGKLGVNYRLRDWSISRQRYWGAPIPIVYDPEGEPHPVPEEHLPWLLPDDVEDFKPKGTAPLAKSKELLKRTEKIFGKGWTPEVDTMDTFVCSSFYQFMYLSEDRREKASASAKATADKEGRRQKSEGQKQKGEGAFIDRKIEEKWMPVDMYIGGAEHACMHLIYARFVTMALKDFGFVKTEEPFKKLVHQGVITNKGAKMSKSKGNVVSPDAFVERHGSDVFRMYLMFMGPFTEGGDWNDTGIKGIDRFVQRVWKLYEKREQATGTVGEKKSKAKLHATIKKVGEDIEALRFNTAISALMELVNVLEVEGMDTEAAQTLAKLLAPLAPHLAEELWETIGKKGFIVDQKWPQYDPALLKADTITIAIQINGKVRGQIEVAADTSEQDVIAQAKEQENVKKYLTGKELRKQMYVRGRLVSFVI